MATRPLEAAELAALLSALASECDPREQLSGRAGDEGWPVDDQWRQYLLSLSAEAVSRCELIGLHHASDNQAMPTSLRRLCSTVSDASFLLAGEERTSSPGAVSTGAIGTIAIKRCRSEAKEVQVTALLRAATGTEYARQCRVRRVVDVGCGRGHLLAELKSALQVPALGLDIDASLLDSARALYLDIDFRVHDVLEEGLLPLLHEGDLVVGLHPCGLLGEVIVEAVAAHGSCAMLMVPCCVHKQRGSLRAARSRAGRELKLELTPSALKKASMALDASATVAPRRARHELRELFRTRGVDIDSEGGGAEMEGVQSRVAKRGLAELAAVALKKRGLPPPTVQELQVAASKSRPDFEARRRISLLEVVLGELLELVVIVDRALCLAEAGHSVRLFRAFEATASDRNLAIMAEPTRGLRSEGAAVKDGESGSEIGSCASQAEESPSQAKDTQRSVV
uniref:Methyltransferase domain-containing protein n=1 Tax=Coccolithus braarudii TaxID=221442 RepID=A0A7S0Q7F2_9EUKA|mmetsp:Transcript_50023/g.106904  ORF Transcript_50023/g.106904 Transcript_50023/m.106904 type:complete len:454 (+) Transcript_50023:71-1432(+)|eukprot:CAMPEP_0183358968 /NCGR_PEP_ID=MMETSP0164_2-20130417/50882_1 /TAXON_ID=221442 /ORGANISM="Coccolithus pelagicus ssp braarudi, Strain PLY182g" /LENGTH=453 /DNA_ID=CAMNT_0025532979 /DNA_START=71 /DNA_END=1432 /DNA_ORIENTATION=+